MSDDNAVHVEIGCDNGPHVFMLDHLQAIADGRAPLSDLPDEVMRSIIAQWIPFIDIIDEFAEGE